MNPQEFIDDYMAGKMTAADKASFEQAMLEDAELRSLVDNYDVVKKVSEQFLEAELLSEVEGVAESIQNQPKPRSTNRYFLVAAILLAIAAAIFYFTRSSQLPEQEIALLNEKFYPGAPIKTTRSLKLPGLSRAEKTEYYDELFAEKKGSELMEHAEYEFELNETNVSKGLIKKAIATLEDSNELKAAEELLGHVLFKQHKYNQAEKLFKKTNAENLDCLVQLCQVFMKKQPVESLDVVCRK